MWLPYKFPRFPIPISIISSPYLPPVLHGQVHTWDHRPFRKHHRHGISAFALGAFEDATVGQSPHQVSRHRPWPPDLLDMCGVRTNIDNIYVLIFIMIYICMCIQPVTLYYYYIFFIWYACIYIYIQLYTWKRIEWISTYVGVTCMV